MTQRTDITKEFQDKLRELRDRAKENGGRLAEDMVRAAFSGISLEEKDLQLIYAYLDQTGIEVYDPAWEEESHSGAHAPSLEVYLEELDRISRIPEDLERRMFDLAASGDMEAKRTLTERYLTAVCDLAGEFEQRNRKIEPEDLVQEANVALLMAMEELEPESSLAAYRVKLLNRITQNLEESLREMNDALNTDARVVDRMNRLADSVHELEEQLEHKPSLEELSAYLDIPMEEIRNLLRVGGEKLTIEDI